MIGACRRIQEIAGRYASIAELQANADALDALAFQFVLLGDAAAKIPDDIIGAHPEIGWRYIRAMRNVVVHNYGAVDFDALWATACGDIPPLESVLHELANAGG